jgi:hypothetical protein
MFSQKKVLRQATKLAIELDTNLQEVSSSSSGQDDSL